MAIDGIFLHYLIEELKPQMLNKRINKIISVNEHDYIFLLPYKQKLLITINPNGAHLRFTEGEYLNSQTSISSFLRKHLEGGVITKISQYNNDRIITLEIVNTDDLGYRINYKVILELTGRKSNLIITDDNFVILECIKKSFQENRIINPKATYEYLESGKINPYTIKNYSGESLEGVSKLLLQEINYTGNLQGVINRKVNPTIIENEKIIFYCFDLYHQVGKRTNFTSLSELLEEYFTNKVNQISINNEQKRLAQYINNKIEKLEQKLGKQKEELRIANDNLKLKEVADVLASNIHLVKRHQKQINVFNFYTNENITIDLNPEISPTENLNSLYNKYKKAKRTISYMETIIENTKAEILYYRTLQNQADLSSISDLKEILHEVGIRKTPIQQKPKITSYIDKDDNIIWVGKNNTQNEYLTFTLANKNDYFFHVVGYPGSHVIFRGTLTDDAIKLAATIAATYSKAKATVSVDYTQVKWVKKIKGQKGSFVTYTHHKSVFAEPDLDYINANTNLRK
ncbi:MAG TPA: fibronectin-binding domain-containing protein [Acholeplasmataceae bacterium]|nr:fibronectin-binding domain-containing protein [Acholeplasmataceae bacterium]